MKSKVLTITEAARVRGLSVKAIYAAIATNRLPRRYYRGNLVVREADLQAWDSLKGKSGRPPGQSLSAEHKARIAAAQKRRWQQRKQDSGNPHER